MLVLPFKMKEKTKGGLHLAEATLEKQQVASQVGLVMAMGPQCYKDKERYPEGPWCKTQDWVMFARYAGSRIKIEGGEMRLLNDDEILATIESPEDILHEF
jgi:chaperonin GroES